MLQKAILLILDGFGDRPIAELGYLTPLEKANTPNLDKLARDGICGMMSTLGIGQVPGSDVAHLTLFGYDINEVYRGRGPIEAAGIGVALESGDVAFRCNIGTVDDSTVVVDRRAGRIDDVARLTKDVDGLEKEADEAVQDLIGGGETNIHEAMIALQKADVSFKVLMEVRDKIVSAYKEVMRMQA